MANKKEEPKKRTTFSRFVHESEPVEEETPKTKASKAEAEPEPSDSVGGPAMPPPVYAVGPSAPVEKRKQMFARQEHDRKELKKKGE